jgi:AraC-like DNA-binding protein
VAFSAHFADNESQYAMDVDRTRGSFGLAEDRFSPALHAHRKHQLLFANRGALELSVEGSSFLLPPQRAAFIHARVPHRVTARGRVALRTVYFDEKMQLELGACRVFSAPAVLVEMILYGVAARRSPHFYAALAEVMVDCAADTHDFRLPAAQSPELRRAIDAIDLTACTLASVARAAAMSTRSLERRFIEETGITFRSYLRTARVLRSMELLAKGARVTDAALGVGFQSLSSFSRAFEEIAGERPREFLRRSRHENELAGRRA